MSDSMSDDDEEFIEDQAEESGEEGSEEEEDDDEEGDDDNDSLINDEEEEGDDDDTESGKRKKSSKKRQIDDRLEDDDYELIRENTGIEVSKSKYRRIQFGDSDEEDDGREKTGRGDVPTRSGDPEERRHVTTPMDEVFGASDDEDDSLLERESTSGTMRDPFLDDVESPEKKGRSGYNRDDYDDIDDFIDDDIPSGGGAVTKSGVFTEPALLEALDVFGEFNPAEFGLVSDEEEDEDEEGADKDVYEEEEDDDEYSTTPRKKRKRKGKSQKSIYDVYEPSEIERGHLTEMDTIIRMTDVPERFQLRAIPVQNSEEGELEKESDWIYHQAFCNPPISRQPHYGYKHGGSGQSNNIKPQSAIPKIKEALNLMRNHFFEVPYIATYRQEYVEPELTQHDLWKVLRWDEKWMELQQRKKSLRKLFVRIRDWQFEKMREEPDKALMEDYRSLEEDDLQRLDAVQNEDELSDVYQHFMLHYGRDVIDMKNKNVSRNQGVEDEELREMEKSSVKHAKKKDYYSLCQEAGLGALASKFGLTAEQFGENLRDNYQRHETDQHPAEPEEAAQDFIQPSGSFTNVRAILQGACHMVAMQIAYEPLVRQALRQVFSTRAVVNVTPTKKGKKEIDENHSCFSHKYLKNKPVREFKADEFLHLVLAEKDGLLSIKISIDIESSTDRRNQSVQSVTYFEEIRMLFYRDEYSMLVEKWNAQRAQAVAHALLKVLYPQMERDIKSKLIQEAKEYVIESCAVQFRKWISVGSYSDGCKVMSCAFSEDVNKAGYCCFLDSEGEVMDYIKLSCVYLRRDSYSEAEREQKTEEMKKIKTGIGKCKPDVIVVSAESRESFRVVDDFKACLVEMENLPDIVNVELMDPNVARLFAKSYRSKESFPSYPDILCQAVSLARRVHEPLTEFTSLLLAQEDEVLSLQMHRLQSSVQQDLLKLALEAELVTKVNEVGVDIGACIEHPHTESLLPFVSGFGPRKAMNLVKTVRQESILIQNRSQLVTQCSIGPQVFINCAGFIKILGGYGQGNSSSVEVLDSTRIHPETYAWATKMAEDAVEYDDESDGKMFRSNTNLSPIDKIMKKPDKLHDLDLDAFAVELQRRGCGNKRNTLYNIRDELFTPFKDHREPFVSLAPEEKFTLLTGETPESLHEGKLITCSVTGIARRKPNQIARERANPIKNATGYWQCPFCLLQNFPDVSLVWSHIDDGSCPGQGIGVRTRLENGLTGFIHVKNLSDNPVTTPEDRVKVGMTVHCRVLSVNIDKFSVELTSRSSDLLDKQGKFSVPKDMYYNHAMANNELKKVESQQNKPKERFIKRVIVHPSFHNVTFSEAEKMLLESDQGEGMFRPSTQGHDRLTLTWKVTDKILAHINIKEEGKPNAYSLGRTLIIGEEKYEDLDEILARFVQPMAANARDLVTHKCYREANGGDSKQLEKYLKEEKGKNPKRIPYFFSASSQYPGKFVLAYQPGTRAKMEYISVIPEGFKYRGHVHDTVNHLINWFKVHFKDPVKVQKPMPPPTQRPGSAIGSMHGGGSSATPYSISSHTGGRYQPGETPYTPSQWMYNTAT